MCIFVRVCTLLSLTVKTNLNTNLVNIFNSTLTRVAYCSPLSNLLKHLSLKFQISTTHFYSRKQHIFLMVIILERLF